MSNSDLDHIPRIDLNNFELEEFRNCEYVLTSPTSLEACKNLNIKPAELLAEVEENSIYDPMKEKMEKERKLKIIRAKIERQRLINEICSSKSNLVVKGKVLFRDKNYQTKGICDRDDQTFSHDIKERSSSTGTRYRRTSMQDEKKQNSLMRELYFHEKRRELEEQAKREKEELCRQMTQRMSRVERNRLELQRKKNQEIESKKRIDEKKAINVSCRRKQLENEILIYYRELERFQNITMKSAEEKIHKKLQSEQNKIQYEREYKELVNRHNRELIEEEVTNRHYETMVKITDREKQNELFMQEKLNKMIESRCLAHEAQKVREEIRQIYNLDSFDKKANYVEIVNQVIKQT